jgi:hypothetical protein
MKGWMETYSGKQFFLEAEGEQLMAQLDRVDIAESLSKQCRYNGHVQRFYSVAEHCILLTGWAMENTPGRNRRLLRTFLLHDAAEAYISDVPSPLKAMLPQLKEMEQRIEQAIGLKYDCLIPHPPIVKSADTRICVDERAQAMSNSGHVWGTDEMEPLGVTLEFWDPSTARDRFLALWAELV